MVVNSQESISERQGRIRITTFYKNGDAHQMFMTVNMPMFWEQVIGLVPPGGSVWIDDASL